MANYANLKAAIDAVIKANGQQEITGPLLNQVLKAMVNALGAGYLFMGIAEHDTNPNTPDQNVFYIALEEGTYTHFGNAQVHFGISLLFWYGQWSVYNLVTFSNTVTDEVEEIPTSYAVFNAVKDAAVYDVTEHTGQRFANLNSLLSSPDIDTLIPPSVRKAGMTIMFTSPAHAVQQQSQLFKHKFFFNAVDMSLFTNVNRWIGIETTVTQYSLNVPTSGAVYAAVNAAKVETIAEAGVFDVTANNDGATFASLSALLNDEDLETLIPVARRKGGMSIKFVHTSDNKYIRYNLIADEFSTDVEDWEQAASKEKLEKGIIIPAAAAVNVGNGTCNNGMYEANKTVNIPNFILLNNSSISVFFTNPINTENTTLNVSNSGAKPIKILGFVLPAGAIKARSYATLVYDGTSWNIVNVFCPDASFDPTELLVDMGLPSGVKWASRDIDITKQGGFCETPFTYEKSYFSWGNIEGHNPLSSTSFGYNWGGVNSEPPYYEDQVYGSTIGNTLTASIAVGDDYDAARANLGSPWRMPTGNEITELFSNIRYINADGTAIPTSQANKLVTVNGVNGVYIESLINGSRLFFAACGDGIGIQLLNRGSVGMYWSSTYQSSRLCRKLGFMSNGIELNIGEYRFVGAAIRPVQ